MKSMIGLAKIDPSMAASLAHEEISSGNEMIMAIPHIVAIVAILIAFVRWELRLYDNSLALGAQGIRDSRTMVIVGTIVPVLNLIVPPKLLHNINNAISKLGNGQEFNAHNSREITIDLWIGTFIACYIFGKLSGKMIRRASLAGDLLPALGLRLLGIVLLICAGWLCIRMVKIFEAKILDKRNAILISPPIHSDCTEMVIT